MGSHPQCVYTWQKALLFILLSTLFPLALFAFLHARVDQAVMAIIQEPMREVLPTQCLAEYLNLSVDHPISFTHFPLKEAKKRLEEMPIIQQATLKKIRPNILYINYVVREPVAILGNQSNLAIDREGRSFPFQIFYTTKQMPLLYSHGKGHAIFLDLLAYPVKMVDLCDIDAPTLGKRQIIVQMEDGTFLRLPVRDYKEAMEHYNLLVKKNSIHSKIIDFRIPNTAYLQNG